MHFLATIDLTDARLDEFNAYEAKVLPLLQNHGARLEMRVRSLDGKSETHLLFFPDAQALANYRADPGRVAVQGEWERCGARSSILEVERVDP
jgi:hypothetical protein